MKKVISLFLVIAMVLSMGTVAFAAEGSDLQVDTNFLASTPIKINDMVAGDVSIEDTPVYDLAGNEVGIAIIRIEKVEDAIIPYSEAIKDYWRADGTYNADISITFNFPYSIDFGTGGKITYATAFSYNVSKGQTQLSFGNRTKTINQTSLTPIPWQPGQNIDLRVTNSSGSFLEMKKTFGYTALETESGLGVGAAVAITSGVKVLPNNPGYMRVYISAND